MKTINLFFNSTKLIFILVKVIKFFNINWHIFSCSIICIIVFCWNICFWSSNKANKIMNIKQIAKYFTCKFTQNHFIFIKWKYIFVKHMHLSGFILVYNLTFLSFKSDKNNNKKFFNESVFVNFTNKSDLKRSLTIQ